MRGRNHHVEDMIFIVPTDMPPNEVRGRYPGMKIDRLNGIGNMKENGNEKQSVGRDRPSE